MNATIGRLHFNVWWTRAPRAPRTQSAPATRDLERMFRRESQLKAAGADRDRWAAQQQGLPYF